MDKGKLALSESYQGKWRIVWVFGEEDGGVLGQSEEDGVEPCPAFRPGDGETLTAKVGQKVWVEYYQNRADGGIKLEVTKVGRKWVELGIGKGRYRVEIGSTQIDGGNYSSPGRVWPSKADADAYQDLVKAWGDLRRRVDSYSPPDLTLEALAKASEVLGLKK